MGNVPLTKDRLSATVHPFILCAALPAVACWDLHVGLLEADGKAGGAERTGSLMLAAVGFYLSLCVFPKQHLCGGSVVPATVLGVSSLSTSATSDC